MKKTLALLLVTLMLMGLCACGNGAQEGEQSEQGSETSTTQTVTEKDKGTEKKEKGEEIQYYTIVIDDGDEKHEFPYLMNLKRDNGLKYDKFKEGTMKVEIVAPLCEIGGSTILASVGNKSISSSITLGGHDEDNWVSWNEHDDKLQIETSGMEDTIMDWEKGDIIRVTGVISKWSSSNLFYMFMSDGEITVENLSR